MARSAIERFIAKCVFDPTTGCVNWTGGKSRGRGHSVWYGVFWFEGKRWFAHRWAAKYIFGLDIDELQVDHECTNALCQHHLQAITPVANRALQWIRAQVGLDEISQGEEADDVLTIPASWNGQYEEPLWLRRARAGQTLHAVVGSPAAETTARRVNA